MADITYLPTRQGFLYLAIVLDACTRRVVGWSMADHLRAELVVDALDMALWNRRPATGLVHHSDHGSQYTSLAFGHRCREVGIAVSMGSVGDCYDNALAESFFATLEMRTGRPLPLAHPHRRPHGRLRLHRGVLQSPPTPLGARLPQPSRVRKEVPFRDDDCLNHVESTVHQTGQLQFSIVGALGPESSDDPDIEAVRSAIQDLLAETDWRQAGAGIAKSELSHLDQLNLLTWSVQHLNPGAFDELASGASLDDLDRLTAGHWGDFRSIHELVLSLSHGANHEPARTWVLRHRDEIEDIPTTVVPIAPEVVANMLARGLTI